MCTVNSLPRKCERKNWMHLDGLLVAPGFGHRGIEGKIIAVKYARENRLPFFGICLGYANGGY